MNTKMRTTISIRDISQTGVVPWRLSTLGNVGRDSEARLILPRVRWCKTDQLNDGITNGLLRETTLTSMKDNPIVK